MGQGSSSSKSGDVAFSSPGGSVADVICQGFDCAGKTTMLGKLFGARAIDVSIPTIGWNIEQVTFRDISFNTWDTGGRCGSMRGLWTWYYEHIESGNVGLVYVIDGSDVERLDETVEELGRGVEQMAKVFKYAFPVLVFSNKMDLPSATNPKELESKLRDGIFKDRDPKSWYVQPSIATEGKGLREGFEWMSSYFATTRKIPKAEKALSALCRSRARKDWWNEMWAVGRSLVSRNNIESRDGVSDVKENNDQGEVADLGTVPEGGVGDKPEMSAAVHALAAEELRAVEVGTVGRVPKVLEPERDATHVDPETVAISMDPNHALAA
eukprot:GFYU01005089.1.p1 GENE.GFYU01005089.1~~GFYU01005089.1.p1  ORF type:complete len:368 (-),score=46.94 GFYU01005089.1:109-1083(-)